MSLHFGILKGVLMSNSFYYFDVFLRHLPSYVTDGELRKLVTTTTVLFVHYMNSDYAKDDENSNFEEHALLLRNYLSFEIIV